MEEGGLQARKRPSARLFQRRRPVAFDVRRANLTAEQPLMTQAGEDGRRDALRFAGMKLRERYLLELVLDAIPKQKMVVAAPDALLYLGLRLVQLEVNPAEVFRFKLPECTAIGVIRNGLPCE